jgi:hypothetical protein
LGANLLLLNNFRAEGSGRLEGLSLFGLKML